ncbi:MAG: hypothetical protein ACRERY_17160 [Pseudomonas sp.]
MRSLSVLSVSSLLLSLGPVLPAAAEGGGERTLTRLLQTQESAGEPVVERIRQEEARAKC